MNRVILLLLGIVLMSKVTFAQTEKGKFIINQDLSMNFDVDDNEYDLKENIDDDSVIKIKNRYAAFSLNPSVGYFLIDNLAVGLGAEFSYSRSRDNFSLLSFNKKLVVNNYYYSFNPFVRYYFGKCKIKPFVGGQFKYGQRIRNGKYSGDIFPGDTEASLEYDKSTTNFFGYQINPGLAYFVNDRIGVSLTLVYDYTKYSDNTIQQADSCYDEFGANIGISISL